MNFELNYTLEELTDRTSKERFTAINLIDENNENYKSLTKNEKMVLCHLVRACQHLDTIHFKMENQHNEKFLNFLNDEISKNNEKAILIKKLFLAQKSMFSPDAEGNQIKLVKNIEEPIAMNFYPQDLSIEEFHAILNKMLDRNKIEEVKKILTQRTIVERKDDELIGIDYIDKFSEFKLVAKELLLAKDFCDDKEFALFLELQSNALLKADPMLDALADKQWATLKNSKFEFTICRETYNDKMTESIFANDQLLNRLKNLNIEINTKDNIGGRVGIVNKEGTRLLYELEKLVDIAKNLMPYKNEYEALETSEENVPQIAIDVDLITLTGDEGAYQAGIVVAQNLPNNDKLSLQIGGGRKNVYHRQIRSSKSEEKLYDELITPSQRNLFNNEAGHWATICHENTHSLGPTNKNLGEYSSIMEEFKADMGMYCFLENFVEKGIFTLEQAKQIVVTELTGCFPKGKPTLSQAHRVRSVMIANRMMEENAINFDENGKLVFNFKNVINASKKMMQEVIRMQIEQDVTQAKKYVEKYFVWGEKFTHIQQIQMKYSKKLNSYLLTPLADKMLNGNFEKNL